MPEGMPFRHRLVLSVKTPATLSRELDATFKTLCANKKWAANATDRPGVPRPKRSDFLSLSLQVGSRLVRDLWTDEAQ